MPHFNPIYNRGIKGTGERGQFRPVGPVGERQSGRQVKGSGTQFQAKRSSPPLAKPKPPEDRSRKCIGNDNTCGGWRAEGTEFCFGHLRQMQTKAAGLTGE